MSKQDDLHVNVVIDADRFLNPPDHGQRPSVDLTGLPDPDEASRLAVRALENRVRHDGGPKDVLDVALGGPRVGTRPPVVKRQPDVRYVVARPDEDPVEHASRIAWHRGLNPAAEVEAIDLKAAFEGVEPLKENYIDELLPFMTLRNPLDVLPPEVRIMVPNMPLPAPANRNPDDLQFGITRYVNIDQMPNVLRSVVRRYQALINYSQHGGLGLGIPGNVKALKDAVAELNQIVQSLPDPPEIVVTEAMKDALEAETQGNRVT